MRRTPYFVTAYFDDRKSSSWSTTASDCHAARAVARREGEQARPGTRVVAVEVRAREGGIVLDSFGMVGARR